MTTPNGHEDEGIAMARFAYYGIVAPEDEAATSNLAPAELSSLVDLVTAQIEYHLREIERLEGIVNGLKAKVKK